MNKRSRRQFLSDIGLSIGALPLVRGLVQALPGEGDDKAKPKAGTMNATSKLGNEADFRYSPPTWQSTFCFPDDPHKSLIGNRGELLYDHAGVGQPLDKFGTAVSFGLDGLGEGTYVRQSLASSGVPIITTVLRWKEFEVELTTFATRSDDEGRVDNVLIEVKGRGKSTATCSPELTVKSDKQVSAQIVDESGVQRGKLTLVTRGGDTAPFCLVDAPSESSGGSGEFHLKLAPCTVSASETARYVVRLPQEGQPAEKLRGTLGHGDRIAEGARSFWNGWNPFSEPVKWDLLPEHQEFLVSSARNIVQSREVKNGKKVFQVGPTIYRDLWLVDAYFILEAARYLGYDAEVKAAVEAIWDLQKEDGSFSSAAGEMHWKDTAAAILLLVRQAELSQDWDSFNQHYPDAWKAMMYLRDISVKGKDDGTPNARYGLLPEGFGDSGIGGKSAEITNSIWALMAAKTLSETADRLFLQRRVDIREYYTDIRVNLMQLPKFEDRVDPRGFTYLPMLMKDDPQWNTTDPKKKPKPQSAQIYMSQMIYPGLMFSKVNPVVTGHVALMKAIIQEEIPAETGWLKENAVWTYNAPVFATTLLWLGQADLARKIFLGFLNHASPLFAWREEQSLRGVQHPEYIGDMPHNWASAECIRFLRHTFVLEADKELRLLQGMAEHDLAQKQPFGLTASPTRWGRISLTLEPAPNKRWVARYKREVPAGAEVPTLDHVIIPRWLPGNVQLEKMTSGVKFLRVGLDVQVDPNAMAWEATYLDFGKKE